MHPRKRLPSMSLLAAFDAAATHGSFTRAADALFLTQSAVSRQIQALEAVLEVALFIRTGKRIVLTEAGARYATDVRSALEQIEQATVRVAQQPRTDVLRLALTPILASKWLLPRLTDFYAAQPDVRITMTTRIADFDLANAGLDAFITDGDGHWPHLVAEHLTDAEVIVVASPALLRRAPLSTPTDLYQHTLLQAEYNPKGWRSSFALNGLSLSRMNLGATFEHTSHLIQAVSAGMGIALVSDILVPEELARGELVVPRIAGLRTERKGFYLLCPPEKTAFAPLMAFRQWLHEGGAPSRGLWASCADQNDRCKMPMP